MPLSNALRTTAFGIVLALVAAGSIFPYSSVNAETVNGTGGNTGSNVQTAPGGNQTTSNCGRGADDTIANPLRFCDLSSLLSAILSAAITLGVTILTLALIYTGFLFVAARGNETALTKAKSALLYTIIGGLILLGAKSIQLVITDTVTSLTP